MTTGNPHTHLAALEKLYKTTLDPSVGFDEKVDVLLDLGRDVFGMALGIVSRIKENDYTVMHVVGPEGAPSPGTVFELAGTYCVHTLAADAPKSFHHAGQSEIRNHPCYKNFQLESYIGAPIFVDNVRYGTLNFSDPAARKEPFTADDHSLINLCAQWIGAEIFRIESGYRSQQQKTLFESMFQSVPDAIVISDPQRTIQMVNPAFTRLFGYSDIDVIGKSTSMLYAGETEWKRQGQLRYKDKGQAQKLEPYQVQYRKMDGTAFWSETVGSPLRDSDGQLLGFLAAGRDITDRLQAETAKQEFISVVSHELRTPLTSISASLEMLQSGATKPIDENTASLIDIARRNSKRLMRLINDILDAEKIRSGKMVCDRQSVDLNAALDQSADEMKVYGDDYGVRLVNTGDQTPAIIISDQGRILQILANLISNAVKVSKQGDRVEIGVTERKGRYAIYVRDFGPGIPEEARDKIFERFTQIDSTTTRKISGTGLGLSITRALVAQMGGNISFETRNGEGTTFSVDFPRPL